MIKLKISEINPHIRYAKTHYGHINTKTNSFCYDCRIFFMENASGSIKINDLDYNFSKGDIIYLPPKTKYCLYFYTSKDQKVIILNFDLINDFSSISDSLGTATEETFKPSASPSYEINELLLHPIIISLPHIKSYLQEIVDNFLKHIKYYREFSSALLKTVLLHLLHKNSLTTQQSVLCEQVFSYIHENYAILTLSNNDIAKHFNYHPYHLNNIVKEETGKTIHNYLIHYRLRIARTLLITTEYNIDQIAWMSGFSSTAYFIKTFRTNLGITPKKYRNVHKTV